MNKSLTVAIILTGACASPTESTSPSAPASASSVEARPTHIQAALEQIASGSPTIEQALQTVVESRDATALAEADARLVQAAQNVASREWLESKRPALSAANAASHLAPTPEQFAAQLLEYQDEQHVRLIRLMRLTGGSASSEYCRAVARSSDARLSVREAALSVVDPLGKEVAFDHLRESLQAREQARELQPGVPNASSVVSSLTPAFARCWREELARNKSSPDVSARIKLSVSQEGKVVEATVASLPDGELAMCLKRVALGAVFAPPVGGSATLIVPLGFENPARTE